MTPDIIVFQSENLDQITFTKEYLNLIVGEREFSLPCEGNDQDSTIYSYTFHEFYSIYHSIGEDTFGMKVHAKLIDRDLYSIDTNFIDFIDVSLNYKTPDSGLGAIVRNYTKFDTISSMRTNSFPVTRYRYYPELIPDIVINGQQFSNVLKSVKSTTSPFEFYYDVNVGIVGFVDENGFEWCRE